MKNMCLGVLLLVVLAGTAIPASAQEAKKGKISLLVNGGLPVGDFSSVTKPGFGGLIQIMGSPAAAPELSLGGALGVMRFSGKDLSFSGGTVTASGLTAIPILAMAQYTFPTEGNAKPYVQTGLGLYHLRTTGSSFNGVGVAPGGGVLIQMTPNRSWFRVEATYHLVEASYTVSTLFDSAGGNVQFFNVLAGVSVAFGH